MEWLTPDVLLQLKDFLCLISLVWLIYWTYRHFVPELVRDVISLLKETVDKDNDGKP